MERFPGRVRFEPDRRVTEPYVLLLRVSVQVNVDGRPDLARLGEDTVGTFGTEDQIDVVGQEIEDGQVVLDDDDHLLLGELLDDPGHLDPLVDVQIGRWFIEEVDVRILHDGGGDGHPLKLSAGELAHVPGDGVFKLQHLDRLLQLHPFLDPGKKVLDRSLDDRRQPVHVLRLHGGLETGGVDLCQVVVQFRTGKMGQHLLPGGRGVEFPEVGHDLPGEQFERGGLADAVRTENAGDLAGLRRGQPVETECVLPVLVDHILLQFVRQTDDLYCREWALVNADTAASAELFRYLGLAGIVQPDGLDPGPDLGAILDALGIALLGLATVLQDGSYPHDPHQ